MDSRAAEERVQLPVLQMDREISFVDVDEFLSTSVDLTLSISVSGSRRHLGVVWAPVDFVDRHFAAWQAWQAWVKATERLQAGLFQAQASIASSSIDVHAEMDKTIWGYRV